jgi:hypothetical protein
MIIQISLIIHAALSPLSSQAVIPVIQSKDTVKVERSNPNACAITLEGLGTVVGGVIGLSFGAITGGSINDLISPPPDLPFGEYVPVGGIIGAGLGYSAGCALGTSLVGSWFSQTGSFWSSLLGANVGLLPGCLLILAGIATNNNTISGIGAVGLFVLPPLGAIIGYNLSGRGDRGSSQSSIFPQDKRINLGGIGFQFNRDRPAIKANIVSVRF